MATEGAGERAVRASIGELEKDTVEAWDEQRKKPWHEYVEAELGFRNHWYPAFFSHELGEADVSPESGEPVTQQRTVTLLGERIFFRRIDGQVYGIQDRCAHKGVPFSAKPECYTRETVTCFYHGFTYDLRSGNLDAILTDPNSPLIGKISLRTYPVEERQGIVFVFVGDGDDPPPLEHDLPPGFLDESLAVYPAGWSKVVKSNWRPAAENGFDPAHAYIHRNSKLVVDYRIPTVLGDTGISRDQGMEILEGNGPKGIKLLRGHGEPVWEAEVDDVKVAARFRPGEPGVLEGMIPEVSIWMPGVLKVDPFPAPNTYHFEWYVPIDAERHRYMMTWARPVAGDEEREAFFEETRTIWAKRVPEEFNSQDVFAREAMQEFYSHEDGWYKERLFGPDVVVTQWRKLASRHNRGVQRFNLQ
jgi:carbazole 1,9a-dioxygenase